MKKKIITDKDERYRLAMSALHQIASYRKHIDEDDYDAYHSCKNLAIRTLESFGKTNVGNTDY